MQFILDHTIAAIVAAILTLALLTQQVRNRQASVERISVYSAKAQSLGFGEWLEDDVAKLGARFGRERGRFRISTALDGDGVAYTDTFRFHYNASFLPDTTIANRVEIEYRVVRDTTVRAVVEEGATPADDVLMPLYRLERDSVYGPYNVHPSVDGWVGGARPTAVPTPGYRAPVGLRHFHIQPMDSEGRPVDDTTPTHRDTYALEADYVRLQFTTVPTLFPLHRARLVPKEGLHWATTIELRPY